MISVSTLHKMTIIDLQGINRVGDQYQWLTDYFGRFLDYWLSKLIFQLIFLNGQNPPIQLSLLSEAHVKWDKFCDVALHYDLC